jgi:hypothetical protein
MTLFIFFGVCARELDIDALCVAFPPRERME